MSPRQAPNQCSALAASQTSEKHVPTCSALGVARASETQCALTSGHRYSTRRKAMNAGAAAAGACPNDWRELPGGWPSGGGSGLRL